MLVTMLFCLKIYFQTYDHAFTMLRKFWDGFGIAEMPVVQTDKDGDFLSENNFSDLCSGRLSLRFRLRRRHYFTDFFPCKQACQKMQDAGQQPGKRERPVKTYGIVERFDRKYKHYPGYPENTCPEKR